MTLSGDSFIDILQTAWRGRLFVLAGAFLGLVIAFLLMATLVPHYEAHMIIAPPELGNEQRSMTVLNGDPSALKEMSISNQIPRDYTKFQQTFRELSAAKIFAQYQGILDEVNKDRIFKFSSGPDVQNSSDLSTYLKEHVMIEPVGPTSSLTLTYRHPDPAFAEKLLRHIHKITDEMIRNDARVQTENRIAYLQKALADTYNPDHRKVLTDLLMQEERQKMLIAMDQPFAAEVVEPSAALPKPVWPRSCIIFPFCLLIGAFFGFVLFSLKTSR